jgi:hypothetical protein
VTVRRIAAVAVVVGLSVCLMSSTAHQTAFAREPSQQRLVYQTTWQQGKIGWSSSGDGSWQVKNGELSYDGSGESAMMAPVSTRGRSNYAIEMIAQALDHGDYNGTYGFGIIFRTAADGDVGAAVSQRGCASRIGRGRCARL